MPRGSAPPAKTSSEQKPASAGAKTSSSKAAAGPRFGQKSSGSYDPKTSPNVQTESPAAAHGGVVSQRWNGHPPSSPMNPHGAAPGQVPVPVAAPMAVAPAAPAPAAGGGLMSGVMGTSMASGMAMLPIRPDIMHPLKVRVQPAIVGGKGGMMSGLMGSMASGMATGVGMSVANRAVDAVMGPRQTEVVHKHEGAADAPAAAAAPAPPPPQCTEEAQWLKQCVDKGTDDCGKYQDLLKACRGA